MPPVPVVTGRQCVAALERAGFMVRRQSGSHIIMSKAGSPILSIPNHNPIKRGTLRAIIRDAGLTVDAFIALL